MMDRFKHLAAKLYLRPLLFGTLLFFQYGCVSFIVPSGPLPQAVPESGLKRDYYHVEITTFDDIKLKATVFQPELKPGQTTPVILHSHGFGVFRMSGPVSLYAKMILSGQAALEAWKRGYWVVSYDQRGHGDSQGMIHVMDPKHEVRDLGEVINWVEENLLQVQYDEQNDPVIGMIGESYGGGLQLLGAGVESRLDAIVPITTWHDFGSSLTPNGVPKSGWLTALFSTVNGLNPGALDPVIGKAYGQARKGSISDEINEYLEIRGVKHHCQSEKPPKIDTLLIQGFRDVLFPINEAVRNYQCIRSTGADVRLLATQGGHLLPLSQFSWPPGYQIEEKIHCGDQSFNTVDVTLAWFDEKLKGITGAAADIPKLCMTHDYKSGTEFENVPIGGEYFEISNTVVGSGFAGFFEWPMNWVDRLFDTPKLGQAVVMREDIKHKHGLLRPAFVPLTIVRRESALAGIPLSELHLESSRARPPVVFVGIGVKRNNAQQVQLISDQITPIKGVGIKQVELAGISTRLAPGDVIGLVIHTYSDQYRFSGSGWLTRATVQGWVKLPLHDLSEDNVTLQAHL